ncbi:MAG: hypothetical protein A2808_03695 [Candidatus Moranbacteria bacterium RIFCSPHIGHO2_01_FULL_55_24]|nr:MAG: hypothetical protein A2808_03695 [Candidatus Moranbacteria bacterium RIFCSPHIGHO2_01_FULL_55_24]
MSLTPAQQFDELSKKTSRPLVLLPAFPSADAIATAYALALWFETKEKEVTVAGDTLLQDKEALSFLANPRDLRGAITGARDFVLSFNTERNKIIDVRTETLPEELRIYLTPEHGIIDPRDFSFIPAKFTFDLAIVIGAVDKERLGNIFEHNADIFYEMPIINIDNHSDNELFGQLNLVDVTASSAAEILADIFFSLAPETLPESVAESLLAGIITATDSFQKKNTTPKSLHLASLLMQHGADQQKIVRSLYKTQPLHLLKLWGKAMAQVKWNEELRLIWSLVGIEDLVHARAHIDDLPAVLEKIKGNYASGQLFVLLSPETPASVRVIIKAQSRELLRSTLPLFPEAHLEGETLIASLPADSLEKAEALLFEKLTPKTPRA